MATDRVDVSKTEVAHIDDSQLDMAGHSKDGEAAEPIHVTLEPVKRLTLLECVRKYKLATLFCLLAAVGTLSDGYQVQMSGSIVALKGFIRTFGDLQDDGTYKVNPQHLALWGCKHLPYSYLAPPFLLVLPGVCSSSVLTIFLGSNSPQECRRHGRRLYRILSGRQDRPKVDDALGPAHHGRRRHPRAVCDRLDALARRSSP
ncbi:hypothetical protein VTK73DRAFT_1484 [Phialemonium thermophilum]|uniref:Uncharacterized protein n=1 Tax=Phialemonium thermophilum TaxID=223376 RepID=A0ABR3VTC6_9PEZI